MNHVMCKRILPYLVPALLVVCLFRTSQVLAATTTASGATAPTGLRLVLPACISSGNCSLDDIVNTGANAANFFTALSAALFFATFVYGGARYLLSFGRKEWVAAGTKAMTGAAIGMAIVMGAWVIVNYVANSLQGIG